MKTKNKRLISIIVAVPILLMIPLIAMQFTDEVNWSLSDFMVMGILLLSTGLICELVIRSVKNSTYRITLCIVVLFMLFLIWAELAVGVFGTPFSGS
ncbi:MAG: membrane protein [Flavobacteriales bacterium BRH_c54]|nr:MAG: membrane protein [Flavobacteriales bacterium BRH_c54]